MCEPLLEPECGLIVELGLGLGLADGFFFLEWLGLLLGEGDGEEA